MRPSASDEALASNVIVVGTTVPPAVARIRATGGVAVAALALALALNVAAIAPQTTPTTAIPTRQRGG